MKKRFMGIIAAIVAIFCGLFVLSACDKVEFKVNFVVDGAVYATLNTNGEEIINMPENPTKDDYDFDGWYWDKDTWQTPFTANSLLDAPLSSDMNVYCKWKPKAVHVSGISLNKSEVSLHVNETEILSSTITPENATDTSVLWESSNATIATVTGGKITALRVGSATITATANDGGQIATCEVYVTPISVERVSLNYTQLSMLYGESKTLTVSVTPQNATETGVIWQSSNASVVAVENGKLTATGYGLAVITATTVDGGKAATCAVEVIDDTITFKTLQVAADGETVYGKVSNATTTFSFLKEIEEHGNAKYQVYEEIECKTLNVSKTISLLEGDNTIYVLQTGGKNTKLYTVTVRRRPIYTVSFDADGGTAVQSQQVEEDYCANMPFAPSKIGYTFVRWDYDFTEAITQNTEIKALWELKTELSMFNFVEQSETFEIIGVKDKSVTEIVVPDYVMRIRAGALKRCSSLKTLVLPFIGEKAGMTPEDNNQYPFGYIFGEESYEGGKGVYQSYYESSIHTNTGVVYNAKQALYYIPLSLRNVTITGGHILAGAFSGCANITDVTIEDSVLSIEESAFSGCTDLTDVKIGKCMNIGRHAFSSCYNLVSVTIGSGVIGEFAFSNCHSLSNVTLEKGVEIIENSAFRYCNKLTKIVIPDSVISIRDGAFALCNNLALIVLSNSVKMIGYQAFYGGSPSERKVYFKNSEIEWDKIVIDSSNYHLTQASRYYYSETEPVAPGKYWHYNENNEIVEW